MAGVKAESASTEGKQLVRGVASASLLMNFLRLGAFAQAPVPHITQIAGEA